AATGRGQGDPHLCPWLPRRHRVADRFHDPGALVTEHGRRGPDPLAADRVQLGAADPDRGHADEDVPGAGLVEVDLPDLEPFPGPAEDCGSRLHVPIAAATVLQSVTVET